MRVALYMATLSAVRCDPAMKAHYRQLRDRGKPAKVALVACMRKRNLPRQADSSKVELLASW
jgi:transposase